jgi:hypothetical protein
VPTSKAPDWSSLPASISWGTLLPQQAAVSSPEPAVLQHNHTHTLQPNSQPFQPQNSMNIFRSPLQAPSAAPASNTQSAPIPTPSAPRDAPQIRSRGAEIHLPDNLGLGTSPPVTEIMALVHQHQAAQAPPAHERFQSHLPPQQLPTVPARHTPLPPTPQQQQQQKPVLHPPPPPPPPAPQRQLQQPPSDPPVQPPPELPQLGPAAPAAASTRHSRGCRGLASQHVPAAAEHGPNGPNGRGGRGSGRSSRSARASAGGSRRRGGGAAEFAGATGSGGRRGSHSPLADNTPAAAPEAPGSGGRRGLSSSGGGRGRGRGGRGVRGRGNVNDGSGRQMSRREIGSAC